MPTLAAACYGYRKAAGMTAMAMAAHIGITQRAYEHFERAHTFAGTSAPGGNLMAVLVWLLCAEDGRAPLIWLKWRAVAASWMREKGKSRQRARRGPRQAECQRGSKARSKAGRETGPAIPPGYAVSRPICHGQYETFRPIPNVGPLRPEPPRVWPSDCKQR